MNEDIVCIGVCINDPETGVCLGCGRQPEPVSGGSGGSGEARRKKNDATPLSAAQYPLPPQVANELDTPSD